MDRISALRNVEEALAAFEAGESTLPELEAEVRGILRSYATDYAEELSAYRASGDAAAEGLVVLASSEAEARDAVAERVPDGVRFDVEGPNPDP